MQINTEHDGMMWLPIAEACVALGMSHRTLARRLAAGRLPTKTDAEGRKLVGVPAEAAVAVTPIIEGSHPGNHPDVGSPTGSQEAATTALALADVTGASVRGWQTAATEVKVELHRTRRITALLAAVVAVLAVAGGVGVWWATRAVVGEQGRADRLTDQVQTQATRIIELADQVQAERQGAEALNEQLRESTAEGAALAASCDALAEQVAEARADLDAAEAKQAAAWAAPEAVVEQGADVPGG